MKRWKRRVVSVGLSVVAVSGALYAGACASDSSEDSHTPEVPPGEVDPLEGVVYRGGATDEALEALLAKEPEDVAAQAVVLDVPADGATLTVEAGLVFRWHVRDALGSLRGPGRPEGRAGSNETYGRAKGSAPTEAARMGWGALGVLFGPERAAIAHGAPLNGRGYYLVVSSAKGEPVLRVFTAALAFPPSEEEWERLRIAEQPLTAVITNAVFENNEIGEGAGPFAGEPSTFTVEP
ncbi:hypothetical protein [Chondromyces crocatus]|uniref:Lipoprotein n=1 Tax=Chondromyces crocatus TaxID=52 RepID=A0A0K1EIS7_CHOCO|nr:hypothetical protein [Chondromyces crocatus]AKT40562.1 uncharacterized protein CMC5_047180 [Chondromyces crocatus]